MANLSSEQQYFKWLETVKVGETVVIAQYCHGDLYLVQKYTVKKLTKTQIVCTLDIGDSDYFYRFHRTDGLLIGGRTYDCRRIEPLTEKILKQIKIYNLINQIMILGSFLNNANNIRELTEEELMALFDVLNKINLNRKKESTNV